MTNKNDCEKSTDRPVNEKARQKSTLSADCSAAQGKDASDLRAMHEHSDRESDRQLTVRGTRHEAKEGVRRRELVDASIILGEQGGVGPPLGEFMVPLPLDRRHAAEAPAAPGCYLIYVGDQPFYAGMSRTNMRARIIAHATGRGSRMVRLMQIAGRALYFEFCAVDRAMFAAADEDIRRTEFFFLVLHSGRLLPGNLRVDGLELLGRRDNPPSS